MENTNLEQLERRRSMRLDLEEEPVRLNWLDKDGKEQELEAICIDISKRGMLIVHEQDLTIGTKMTVNFTSENVESEPMYVKVARCHRKNFTSYHIFLLFI